MTVIKFELTLAILLAGSLASAESFNLMDVKFDLAKHKGAHPGTPTQESETVEPDCYGPQIKSLKVLKNTLNDPRLPEETRPRMKVTRISEDASGKEKRETVYVFPNAVSEPYNPNQIGPRLEKGDEPRIMGLTAQQAQLASRDGVNMRACSPGHEQGDLANRYCHSMISQTVVSAIFGENGSPVVKAVAEGFVWAPKEFLYDLNPSASDLTFTYRDTLGTKRSKFEVTVFGDTLFDNHVKKVKPFSGSFPSLTWTRKLGPRPRD